MMKRSSAVVFLAAAALFLFIAASATTTVFHGVDASVMGIDLGLETIKMAAPKNNNMDIVLNEQAHRKSWNAVGFRGEERYFAEDAKNFAARFPDNMFLGITRIVGTLHNDTAMIDWYRNQMNFKAELGEFKGFFETAKKNKKGGKKSNGAGSADDVAASDAVGSAAAADADGSEASSKTPVGTFGTLQATTGKNPTTSYSTETLTAMIFTYIKSTVEKDSKLKISDAVVTIPAHLDRRQRQALIDAADIAGVRVIALLHSTTAVALQYGMNRKGFGNETVTIMVVDVGAGHTDVGVYTFSPTPVPKEDGGKGGKKGGAGAGSKIRNSEALGTITTNAIVSTNEVGGRAFDTCLAKHIENKFMEQEAKAGNKKAERVLGGATLTHRKAVVSLMRGANKAKEMLSSNSVAPIVIEGINQDKDFSVTIDRKEFETACASLIATVPKIVAEAARRAGITDPATELHAMEMFGGGVRVPKLLEQLSAWRGKPVDRTLNGDESAALGAGFAAGSLAGRFRIKSLAINETLGATDDQAVVERNITFVLTPKPPAKSSADAPKHRSLYSTHSRFGARKSVTVNRNEDFGLYIYNSFAQTAAESNGNKEVSHEQSRTLERLVNVTGIQAALDSVTGYYASTAVDFDKKTSKKDGDDDDDDDGDSKAKKKPSTDSGADPNTRTLKHPNNTHSIRVDFRLSESGIVELEQAELRATYIQNVTRKVRVNLTEEEIAEANEQAIQRVTQQEAARLEEKKLNASKAAAENNGSSSSTDDAENSSSSSGEKKDGEASSDDAADGDDKKDEESSDVAENSSNNNNSESSSSSNSSKKKGTNSSSGKKKKKKPIEVEENTTEILERKIKIALKAVRTYRMVPVQGEEARRKTLPLSTTQSFVFPSPYLSADKTVAKRMLRVLDDADQLRRDTSAAKNDLEAYIVWAKNEGILENAQMRELKLLPEDEEKKVVEALSAVSTWLEEDGAADDTPLSAYKEKFKELHVATGAVVDRFDELTRPKKSEKKGGSKKKTSKKSTDKNKGKKDDDSKDADSTPEVDDEADDLAAKNDTMPDNSEPEDYTNTGKDSSSEDNSNNGGGGSGSDEKETPQEDKE